jgi:uncharacterized protein (DUF302 family)
MRRHAGIRGLALPVLLALALVGCGDDDDGVVLRGQFLDAAVDGLRYATDTLEGETSDGGWFRYRDGERVRFYIGGLPLGEAAAAPLITPLDLVEGPVLADGGLHHGVVNRLRLLQTLDADGDPYDGRIALDPDGVSALAASDLDLDAAAYAFETDAQTVLGTAYPLVPARVAVARFVTGALAQPDLDLPPLRATENALSAFERLATREVAGLSAEDLAAKTAQLVTVLGLIEAAADGHGFLDVAIGTGSGQMGLDPQVPSPPVDLTLDGVPDELGRSLELTGPDDAELLLPGLAHGLALPLPIGVYTDGDRLEVVAIVPQTLVRTFYRGEDAVAERLMRLAARYQGEMETLVHDALEEHGFTILNEPVPGTTLDEATIAAMEEQMGPLTLAAAVPSVEAGTGVTVEELTAALEAVAGADTVPDLNQNGTTGEDGNGNGVPDDHEVLPGAFAGFLAGQMSMEELQQLLAGAANVWANGGTFQAWEPLRTLDLSGAAGDLRVLEVCQSFYAGNALMTGLHHIPAMPCTLGVWEEGGSVRVGILDVRFLFAYYFRDGLGALPGEAMQQLFAIFPTFVQNELVSLTNAALASRGVEARFQLAPLGP